MSVHLLLIVVALVLFIVAALNVTPRFNLVAAGLAFLTASFLF